MIAYLDSSALVKLVVAEAESDALRASLRERPRRVSSALARTELVRAALPEGDRVVARARQVLAGLALLPLDDAVLDAAGVLEPSELRSLDALHLATAVSLGDELETLIAYDRRLLEAALAVGLPVLAPA